jgi:hypothetical protein
MGILAMYVFIAFPSKTVVYLLIKNLPKKYAQTIINNSFYEGFYNIALIKLGELRIDNNNKLEMLVIMLVTFGFK